MLNQSSSLMREQLLKALWVLLRDFRQLAVLTIIMYMTRLFLERYVFSMVGILIGVRDKRTRTESTEQLKNDARNFSEITEQRHSTSMKFCSSAWKFLYYVSIFSYGLYILWKKPWLWDINKCWRKFGRQKRTNDLKAYHFVTLAYYCSMLIRQVKEGRRSDFLPVCLHHAAMIMLLSVCWATGIFRAGGLLILVHDCADIFLEFAKMSKYSGRNKQAIVFFLVFSFIWVVTRLGLLPFWIIKNIALDAPRIIRIPAYYVVTGLLLLLQVLHIHWTYYIFRVFYRMFSAKGAACDPKPETEASNAEPNVLKHKKTN